MPRAAWIVLACTTLVAGCATNGPEDESGRAPEPTPKAEKRAEPNPAPSPPRNEKTVRFGTVDSVRPVTLPGKDSGAGALVGAVGGGIAGAESYNFV